MIEEREIQLPDLRVLLRVEVDTGVSGLAVFTPNLVFTWSTNPEINWSLFAVDLTLCPWTSISSTGGRSDTQSTLFPSE